VLQEAGLLCHRPSRPSPKPDSSSGSRPDARPHSRTDSRVRTPESKAGTEIDDSWDFLPELNITPPVGFYTGKLTVRLSPHPEDKDVTPFLNLSVTVHMPTNVSDPPVIFVHCGGPGSGVECVNNKVMLDNKSKARYSGYAVVAIDQRGVGSDTNPSFECDMKQLKEPPPRQDKLRHLRLHELSLCSARWHTLGR